MTKVIDKSTNSTLLLKSKNRMQFIDTAKGIGMLLVVYAHINYQSEILTTIYAFHMPLFFIISGILFNRQNFYDFKHFIKKKVQTLICPYILFYLLSIIYTLAMDVIAVGVNNLSYDKYLSYLVQMFLAQGSSKSVNAPLWFVPCLLMVEILYYFISKLNVRKIVLTCAILVFVGWLIESGKLPFDNTLLPWSLDSALFALGFLALGNLCSEYIKKLFKTINLYKHKLLICFLVFAVFISATIFLGLLNGKVSLGSKILNNGFLFYLTGISGTIAIFSLSLIFEKNKLLQYIGKNSFYIMSSHYLIRNFIQTCYRAFDIPKYDIHSISQTFFPVILVLFLSLVFTVLYNFVKNFILKHYKKGVALNG